jgi:phage tail-like protein
MNNSLPQNITKIEKPLSVCPMHPDVEPDINSFTCATCGLPLLPRKEYKEYINFLPEIFQGGIESDADDILCRLLQAFEALLSGREDAGTAAPHGIERILDVIEGYFDPFTTPPDFLPWLASWVALSLRKGVEWVGEADAADKEKNHEQSVPFYRNSPNRTLLSQIVQLYRMRGTKEGLEEYLKIFVGDGVKIFDELGPFQVGISSRVGVDTVVEGLPPHFFVANITLTTPEPALMKAKKRGVEEILDSEKPAHTYYKTNFTVPALQVGVHSRVGTDTLLWEQ